MQSYAQTNNCGNFLISVKMFCFNLFFHFRFIFWFLLNSRKRLMIKMEMMKSRMHSRRWRRSWRWEGRRRGSDVIEEFLVWQPAPAREHSSEGFDTRKVIEVKEEDGYEENVKEDFAVAASDKDDGKVWNLCWKFLVQWWVFQCSRGRWRLFFDEDWIYCGNIL